MELVFAGESFAISVGSVRVGADLVVGHKILVTRQCVQKYLTCLKLHSVVVSRHGIRSPYPAPGTDACNSFTKVS